MEVHGDAIPYKRRRHGPNNEFRTRRAVQGWEPQPQTVLEIRDLVGGAKDFITPGTREFVWMVYQKHIYETAD